MGGRSQSNEVELDAETMRLARRLAELDPQLFQAFLRFAEVKLAECSAYRETKHGA